MLSLSLAGCDDAAPSGPPTPAVGAAPTAAAASPASESVPEAGSDLSETYATMMDSLADAVVRKTAAAADADYDTFADAKEALDGVLPHRSLARLDVVLQEHGVTKAQMAEFMRANPDQVERVGAAFEARLSEAEPDLLRLIAKVGALAPEDSEFAAGLERQGYGALVAKAAPWPEVASLAELAELAIEARDAGKGLLLDVRADWCLPCRELEEKTFADPKVASRLSASFVTVRLDVTDPAEPAARLQAALGAETLPRVLAWSADDALVAGLEAGSPPAAGFVVDTFMRPTEFLQALERGPG